MRCAPGRKRRSSRAVVSRFAAICFTLLAAAIAIDVAVRLIESVAVALTLIAAGIGSAAGVVALMRQRLHDRW